MNTMYQEHERTKRELYDSTTGTMIFIFAIIAVIVCILIARCIWKTTPGLGLPTSLSTPSPSRATERRELSVNRNNIELVLARLALAQLPSPSAPTESEVSVDRPTLVLKSIIHKKHPKLCSICSDEFKYGDDITWSKNEECVHAFHKDCIVPWLMNHDDCPNCRNDFLSLKGV